MMIIEWFCQCTDLSVVMLSLIVKVLFVRVLQIHSDLSECFVGQFVHENIILC